MASIYESFSIQKVSTKGPFTLNIAHLALLLELLVIPNYALQMSIECLSSEEGDGVSSFYCNFRNSKFSSSHPVYTFSMGELR